jgi:hypothetical protein
LSCRDAYHVVRFGFQTPRILLHPAPRCQQKKRERRGTRDVRRVCGAPCGWRSPSSAIECNRLQSTAIEFARRRPRNFSNHWKLFFQSLENSGQIFQPLEKSFPIIGKFLRGPRAAPLTDAAQTGTTRPQESGRERHP